MSSDESSRGMLNQPNRKPMMSKFGEKNHMYNSGSNYNSYGNSSYNNGNSNNFNSQHPRRRTDRYKRETLNLSEKLIKQNDIIIRLLKEIRDRLPKPAFEEADAELQDQKCNEPMPEEQCRNASDDEPDQENMISGQEEDMLTPGNEK